MLCSFAYCNISRPSRKHQLVSFGCHMEEPQKYIRARIVMFYRFKRYQQFLLDVDLDLCDIVGKKTKEQPLAEALLPFVRNYSNLLHPCPHEGLLKITNAPVDNRYLLGTILPNGQYRFDANVYDSVSNRTMFHLKLFVTVLYNYEKTSDTAL